MAALDPAVAAIRQRAVRRRPMPRAGSTCPGRLLRRSRLDGPGRRGRVRRCPGRCGRAGHSGPPAAARFGASGPPGRPTGRPAGFAPVVVTAVDVGGRSGGPEAAARDARYGALVGGRREHGAAARAARPHPRRPGRDRAAGAGARGRAARAGRHPPVRRAPAWSPWYGRCWTSRGRRRARRARPRAPVWEDPHNSDPAYRRTHARALLASLVERLGPGRGRATSPGRRGWPPRTRGAGPAGPPAAAVRVADADGGCAVAELATCRTRCGPASCTRGPATRGSWIGAVPPPRRGAGRTGDRLARPGRGLACPAASWSCVAAGHLVRTDHADCRRAGRRTSRVPRVGSRTMRQAYLMAEGRR